MGKKNLWKGCGTALVTPFDASGRVDEKRLDALVDFQIKGGVDFLVPCGTTGESPTLGPEEHRAVVERVVARVRGRIPVIAGVGGNNTAKVVETAKAIADLGVDGILSVTPYYNKPTQEGLFQHFKALAEAVDKPIIVYNVPGRTAVNLLPGTVVRLSEVRGIAGIKEASGDIGQVAELASQVPPDFLIFSGDDAITLPIIALGGKGIISVASNEIPREMTEMTHAALSGKWEKARVLQKKLLPLMKLNFIETSPAPVKAALAMMGMIDEVIRLPLVPIQEESRTKLRAELKKLGLIR
jgi:4-hydroxy-tetrahydrodipicolinate synthase